jgi:hypothetical protein
LNHRTGADRWPEPVPQDVRLLYRHGVTLLGISRRGTRGRVRQAQIKPEDILRLLGPEEQLAGM